MKEIHRYKKEIIIRNLSTTKRPSHNTGNTNALETQSEIVKAHNVQLTFGPMWIMQIECPFLMGEAAGTKRLPPYHRRIPKLRILED
jgi:hypothetical protein